MNVYTYKTRFSRESSFFLGSKDRRTTYSCFEDFFKKERNQDLTEHFSHSWAFDLTRASFCVPEEFLK